MFNLASAGNVLIPAYQALLQKGYAVRQEVRGENELWVAEAEGRRFVAEDTLSLLGLVGLYEARGEEWQVPDEIIDGFLAQFYPNQ